MHRNIDDAFEKQIILTTYSTLCIDIEKLKEKESYYIVLDESQNIKNMHAQTSKAGMLMQCQQGLALAVRRLKTTWANCIRCFP